MAHGYRAVIWTPYKKAFDVALALGVVGFIGAFVAAALLTTPPGQTMSELQLLMRAFGACAFAILTLILMIGPLTRLDRRFLPLLYNRRHLGVTCFVLGLVHSALVLLWYHGFSDLNPLVSLLTSNPRYDSIGGFPFEVLGLVALAILFALAATSHDLWNALLGPRVWKSVHMAVYWAYGLLVAHILLGAVQTEKSAFYPLAVGVSAAAVIGLHLIAGLKEARADRAIATAEADGWLMVCRGLDIPDGRARIVTPPQGEKIAVFRDGMHIHALSNVCRHQGGPLGEGRIIDGCVTCPWHGFQYQPQDGRSPPPYEEKIATYRTRLIGDVVWVHPDPLPPGTDTPPARIEGHPP